VHRGSRERPGIYEVPLGMNMKKFIYDVAGGIPNKKKLKAVIPGGSSCPLITADEIDIPMDYDSVAKAGSMLGFRRHGDHGRRHLHGGHGAADYALLRA